MAKTILAADPGARPMPRLRILVLCQNYAPAFSFGGAVANAVGIAEELARRGHSVAVATSSVTELNQNAPRRARVAFVNGIPVTYLGTWFQYHAASFNPGIVPHLLRSAKQFD